LWRYVKIALPIRYVADAPRRYCRLLDCRCCQAVCHAAADAATRGALLTLLPMLFASPCCHALLLLAARDDAAV